MAINNDKTQAQKPVQSQNSQPLSGQQAPRQADQHQDQNWQQGQKPVQGQNSQSQPMRDQQRAGQSAQVNTNKTSSMDIPNQKK